ncbi:amidohydrolase family protein [Neptuniibacter caesariensis]|uniref:Amidohydrolase-related domain-containing protein n=1 Tax=Neptuniibacter caesariensis TaxID=207954 RepID=A0A7U8C5R5_NEPCE|nr:amidohydrolase family protein [Neptuniibacter caesariensis]EAR60381.1 hypothetical protein MED92_00914 [Oceanospirillum sp. MED92] [Neptuniibacter caesariensis]
MSKVVDPHIHLFNLDAGNYDWLNPEQAPEWPDKDKIRRSYLEQDLLLGEVAELAGFVHIEAGFDNANPEREIAWLEDHCTKPFRSIAYADLTSSEAESQLQRLAEHPSVVGVRFILDEQAEAVLANPQFKENLAKLESMGLIFEAQLPLADTNAVNLLSDLMTTLPDLKVVVNHTGSPVFLTEEWMNSITQLAHHPECYIKCSGWEMFKRDWEVSAVKPLISFAIRQFGLTRVMLASNFPVSELSLSYADFWKRNLKEMKWKGFEKDMLCYDNAVRIYQIPVV